jgi:hypothetical protein
LLDLGGTKNRQRHFSNRANTTFVSRACNLTSFSPCLTGPVDYLFASRPKGPRFKSPGGYLCETRILLLALSRHTSNVSAIFAKVEHSNFGQITNHLSLHFLVFQPPFHPDDSAIWHSSQSLMCKCSETTLTGESRFHISTPLGF